MEAWLIALIAGVAVYLVIHLLFKTVKFILKFGIAAVIALALYYLLRDTVVALLTR